MSTVTLKKDNNSLRIVCASKRISVQTEITLYRKCFNLLRAEPDLFLNLLLAQQEETRLKMVI